MDSHGVAILAPLFVHPPWNYYQFVYLASGPMQRICSYVVKSSRDSNPSVKSAGVLWSNMPHIGTPQK